MASERMRELVLALADRDDHTALQRTGEDRPVSHWRAVKAALAKTDRQICAEFPELASSLPCPKPRSAGDGGEG